MSSVIRIAREVTGALSYLNAAEDVRSFGRVLGFDFDPISDELGPVRDAATAVIEVLDDVEEILQTMEALDDPTGADAAAAVENFVKIFGGLKDSYDKVTDLANSFRGGGRDDHLEKLTDDGTVDAFVKEFFERAVGWVAVSHLSVNRPAVLDFLRAVSVIESTPREADADRHRTEFVEHKVHWGRISDFLKDPTGTVKDYYRWEQADQDLAPLLKHVESLALARMIPASLVNTPPEVVAPFEDVTAASYDFTDFDSPSLRILLWDDEMTGLELEGRLISLPPTTGPDQPGLGFELRTTAGGPFDVSFSENITLAFDGAADLQSGLYLAFVPGKPPAFGFDLPEPDVSRASLRLASSNVTEERHVLLGSATGSRLEIGCISGAVGVEVEAGTPPDLFGEIHINDGRVVIKTGEGDGFIQRCLPDLDVDASFDLIIGWSSGSGLYFRGSGHIEISIPLHLALGPVTLQEIYIFIRVTDDGEIPITLAVTASVELGPVVAVVKRIGVTAQYSFPDGGGNRGPLQFDPSFKFPEGAGVGVYTGPVRGCGYLECDPDNERYSGIIQLSFGEIGLIAIGLIATQTRDDGSKLFSMLLIIGVTFDPPITLPYNFNLSGVGGLVGIHRSMIVEVLRQGLKNRTLDSIMFPEDPIRNAPKIISDLRAVYPVTEGRYVVGPMAIINWCNPPLIRAEIAILIEFPAPIRIAILGQIAAELPSKDKALVKIHLDVLGIIDFEKKTFSLDAVLYDSFIKKYPLSGESAMRLNWGDQPNFALAAGGLHPNFDPPPGFPSLARLCLSVGSGNNPRINLKAYMALTSNSAQFGSRLEVYAKKAGFTVQGTAGFDALFIFSPFSFEVGLGARVSVKKAGKTLLSATLDLTLSGPKPWRAKGKVKFEVLGFEKKVSFNKKWGKGKAASLPEKDPWVFLRPALEDPRNWRGKLPAGTRAVASLRTDEIPEDGDFAVVQPMASLEIHQRVVPLNFEMDCFGNAPISGAKKYSIPRLEITPLNGGGSVTIDGEGFGKEFFARAQFEKLSDSAKLSTPSFEKFDATVIAGGDDVTSVHPIEFTLSYETEVIDEDMVGHVVNGLEANRLIWAAAARYLGGGAAHHAAARAMGLKAYAPAGARPGVTFVEESYAVATVSELTREDTIAGNEGPLTFAEAGRLMDSYVAQNPEAAGTLQVVADYEVAE